MNPASGAPFVACKNVKVTAGSSRLFMQNLLPTTSTFAVNGDPASGGFTAPCTFTASPFCLTYRVEVGDTATSTNYTGLNVFVVTDNTVVTMPATSLVNSTDNSMTGTVIQDTTPQVVLFSA